MCERHSSLIVPMQPTSSFPSRTAKRDRRRRLGTFRPVALKSASAGVTISSRPSSACWICDETMQINQSSKLRDACRNMSTGRSFVPERPVNGKEASTIWPLRFIASVLSNRSASSERDHFPCRARPVAWKIPQTRLRSIRHVRIP